MERMHFVWQLARPVCILSDALHCVFLPLCCAGDASRGRDLCWTAETLERAAGAPRTYERRQRVGYRPSGPVQTNSPFFLKENHHGHNYGQPRALCAVEQGQADRAEATPEAQGDLGNSDSPAAERENSRLAMFNLAIDSKLWACDLTRLRVRDVGLGSRVAPRAIVMQEKTLRPVQFEISEQTRDSVESWIKAAALTPSDFLFPGRIHASPHLSTRQYARLVHGWVRSIGLDDTAYGTHTMRRTKASLWHPHLRAAPPPFTAAQSLSTKGLSPGRPVRWTHW